MLYDGATLPADLRQCLDHDDDGGGGLDSSITLTVSPRQSVVIYATVIIDGLYGDYEVTVAGL